MSPMGDKARPLVFRLYPERGKRGLYIRVRVHETKRAMKAAAERVGTRFAGGPWGRRLAYCNEIQAHNLRAGRWRRDPCVAEVNFTKRRLGTEITTHELFHATMAWGRRVGFQFGRLGDEDSVNDDEERITYVHGWLCRQFAGRAWATGLYR